MVTTAVLTDSTGPRGASVSTGAESQRAVSQANAELLTGAVELHALREAVAGMDAAEREAEAIDRIRALEELKATCAAAQARESAALDTLRRAREAAAGVSADQQGRGLGAEIALARREPAHQGGRHLGLARALCREMPHTMNALSTGTISEYQATVMARETAWVDVEHRRQIDELMSARLGRIGTRRLAAEAKAHAQRLDQDAAVKHLERSMAERRVSVRPAPGGMSYLAALLPMPQAVATYAALHRDAATAVGAGDEQGRTRDQIMADLLVERVTGQQSAAAVPIELQLVMTDQSLLSGDGTAAWIPGQGPLPAETARRLASDPEAEVFLRRLYTTPESGQLAAMDSRARIFPPLLRRMIVLRDDLCRTPWCEAPIRHADHATSHHRGGPTSYDNGSGLCARCNLTKENRGWIHEADREHLSVTTPTGHRYLHDTPPLTVWAVPAITGPVRGHSPPPRPVSPGEARVAAHLDVRRSAQRLARLSVAAALTCSADRVPKARASCLRQ